MIEGKRRWTQMLAEQHRITLGSRSILYTLKRSSKARHARLEIRPEAGLIVVVPSHYGMDHVRPLLLDKQRWIVDKLDRYASSDGQNRKPIVAGDLLPYLGRSLTIETRESGNEVGTVHLGDNRLVVCTAPGAAKLHLSLEKWYREQAKNKIGPMVEEFSRRMGLRYNRVTLKGQKTLWGSCSRKRNLNFNWKLVMTPEPVIEYVVVHELAHLKQLNHSRRFWEIVEEHCPSWREHRRWLRDHSQELARLLPA
jgi:predicted metal-dependent hydrolase